MTSTPRQRFIEYVRQVPGARPTVSPFLPKPELVSATLRFLGLPAGPDPIRNEIRLSRALDYEPMFMTDCPGLLFPWTEDEGQSDEEWVYHIHSTADAVFAETPPENFVAFLRTARAEAERLA